MTVQLGLELQSTEAKKTWGGLESKLPMPIITKVMTPADHLINIVKYARGANSRGEWLFRQRYLKPWLVHYVGKDAFVEDEMGNIVVQIGEGEEPWNTLHVGHIDSVHPDDGNPLQEIELVKDDKTEVVTLKLKPWVKQSVPEMKKGIRWVDGKQVDYHFAGYDTPAAPQRCLGADDGCAVAVMLYLISQGTKGTYLFTRGEEVGCRGTKYMIENMPDFFKKFKRAIEVDRKGTDEIIYKMSVGNCASLEFTKALGAAIDMQHKPSDKGSITDVGHIAKLVPENVNISAGYWLQHSANEYCVPAYLNTLGKVMATLDWDALPTKRVAGVFYPAPTKRSNPRNNNFQHGYAYTAGGVTSRNAWGDWSSADMDCELPFDDAFLTEHAARAFIRENGGLLWEVLSALNYSTAELCDIAINGVPQATDIDADFQEMLVELEANIEDADEEDDDVIVLTDDTSADEAAADIYAQNAPVPPDVKPTEAESTASTEVAISTK